MNKDLLVTTRYKYALPGTRMIEAAWGGPVYPNASTATGSVCDGKYYHHFFELPTVPSSGGVQVEVQKTSGELDDAKLIDGVTGEKLVF